MPLIAQLVERRTVVVFSFYIYYILYVHKLYMNIILQYFIFV
jgi:hypothetical protein